MMWRVQHLAILAAMAVPASAWAQAPATQAEPPPVAPTATTPAAPRAAPREQLRTLEKDPALQSQGRDILQHARIAFERADNLRSVGDAIRAKLAESAGEQWVRAALELRQTLARRVQAADAERKARETEAQREKTQAMVEEAFAQQGRLEARLAAALAAKNPKAREALAGEAAAPGAKKTAPATDKKAGGR